MENYDRKFWGDKKCPPINCRKKQCECGLEKIVIPTALGDDSKDSPVAPKNGAYCNAIVVYEANSHVYIYSKEGIPTLVYEGHEVTPVPPVVGGGFIVYLSRTPDIEDGEVTLFRDEQKTVPITIREILDLVSEGTYVLFRDKSQNSYYPLIYALDWSENEEYEIAFRDINSQFHGSTTHSSDSTISFSTSLHEAFNPAELNKLRSGAPGIDTVGELGQLYTDTSTMHTYQCTAIAGNNYTWTQRW